MNLVHEGLYCTHQNLALSPLNILWLRTTWSAENAAFCVDRSPAASLAASGESVWFIYSLLKKVSPLTQDHKEWSRQSKGSVIFSFWTGQRHHSSFFFFSIFFSLKLLHLPLCLPGWAARGLAAGRHLGGPEPHPPPLRWVHTCDTADVTQLIHSFIHSGHWSSYCSANDFFCFHTTWQDTALPPYFRKNLPLSP